MSRTAQLMMAYAVLYLVWGSTYLAMRFAVETLPPFSLAAARFSFAGLVLIVVAKLRGDPWPTPRQVLHMASVGLFLCLIANGGVVWAAKRVPSGTSALIVATTPVWLALFTGERLTRRRIVGIVLGLSGVMFLVGPSLLSGSVAINPAGALALSVSALSWALGSVIQRRERTLSTFMASGLQMATGAMMLALLAVVLGEPAVIDVAHASTRSLLAVVYLALFGSLLGFTTYGWLLRNDDASRVATYTYVNPVVAVILGALLAHEELTGRMVGAAAIILAGVALIVGDRRAQRA